MGLSSKWIDEHYRPIISTQCLNFDGKLDVCVLVLSTRTIGSAGISDHALQAGDMHSVRLDEHELVESGPADIESDFR